MATLTIKHLPDELYGRLKRSAKRNRRSIAAEAEVILERGLDAQSWTEEELIEHARQLRERSPLYLTDEQVRAAIDEGRA